MIDTNFDAVEINSVFFLPILSQRAPPGNRNTAQATRFEEIINPRDAVEKPNSSMYKLKMTEKMPILMVVKERLNKNILEFLENDFIRLM